jgi:serine/threonine protein kinase
VVDLAAILHLAVQVAQGLLYLHQAGVCHGNLKPQNVLLSSAGSMGARDLLGQEQEPKPQLEPQPEPAPQPEPLARLHINQQQLEQLVKLQARPAGGQQHAAQAMHAKLSDYGVIRALIKARSHRTTKSLGAQRGCSWLAGWLTSAGWLAGWPLLAPAGWMLLALERCC